jgi:hypothetical protein
MNEINWNDWNIEEKESINFVEFLKENNAYYKFINNRNFTYNGEKQNNSFDFEQFYNNWDEYNYIYSFIWCKSNEGFLFWEKLNHKWHNKLKNYYK